MEAKRIFIKEYGLRLLERYSMFSYVFCILSRIPVKYRVWHMYTVCTAGLFVNLASGRMSAVGVKAPSAGRCSFTALLAAFRDQEVIYPALCNEFLHPLRYHGFTPGVSGKGN